jgi:hypothetical protein
MDKSLLDALTLPARLVMAAGATLAFGGTWTYVWWVYEGLSPGRYPLLIFAAPILVGTVVLIGTGLGILRCLRVPIMHKPLAQSSADDPAENRRSE